MSYRVQSRARGLRRNTRSQQRSRSEGRRVVTEPIRVWRKSSYSGADNGCVELLTPVMFSAVLQQGRWPPGPA
ncbi:DUF397 domain-containing protein [Streptomyces sp. W16]|uniref:DUF397 domain-containing protein n=1 Tax=Streptomyces sp. W16 TaxID=3076631 RepID=UPI003FA3A70B